MLDQEPLPPPPPTGPITLELPRIGTAPMAVRHSTERRTVLNAEAALTADQAWALYDRAFQARRRPEASYRPDLSREGFDAVMDDPRVTKLVVVDQAGGTPVGLAMVSCDLATAPDAVGRTLRNRWPALVETGRIWYVSLLLIDPDYQDGGTTSHLLGGIWAKAAAEGGLTAVDTGGVSDASMNVPTALFQLAREFAPRTTLQHLDDPRFWAYEFPRPQAA